MQLEGIMLSEISQVEKDKYHVNSLIYGISRAKQINKQTKHTHQIREQIGGYPMGGVLRG